MKNLDLLIQKLGNHIPHTDRLNPKISAAPVGWHIEHSLLTIDAIISALAHSNPDAYKSSFVFSKMFVFATGKIPRGRAMSPQSVTPKDDITATLLKIHIENTRSNILRLADLHHNSHFEHPYFKKLNLRAAVRFIEIHTSHHLDIVEDILVG